MCLPGPALAQESGSASPWYAVGPGVDWSLSGRTSYRVTGDINRDLDPGSQEALLTQAVTAGLILDAETKRALVSAELGLTASHFLGEDPDLDGETRLDPSLNLRGTYRGKRYTVNAALGLDIQEASVAQTDDTGTTESDTTQFSVRYSTGLEQQIDQLNTFILSSSGTLIDFSEASADLTPSVTFGLGAGWRRQLTETSTLTLTTGLRQFMADDTENTRSQVLDLLASLSHQRTSRHTFGGSLGSSFVRTKADGEGVDFEVGLTGGVSFDYRFSEFALDLDLSQAIEPSSEGELQAFSRFGMTLSYDINAHERINLAGDLSRRAPLGSGGSSTLDRLSLATTYSYALSEATQLSLGYVFQGSRDSDDGTAFGHRIFLSAERRFDVVP